MQEPNKLADEPRADTAFSNSIRLNGRDWLCVGLFALVLLTLPEIWKRHEDFTLEPDYRLPHDLSNDYWLFARYANLAADKYDTFLFGDSVVWGEYVTRQQTLSHYLNEYLGQERCANLGLDGAHPLALEGLIQNYAADIAGKNVILQCNPLWLTSAKSDLQDEKATEFNHPRLVPQFIASVPAYKAEVSPRIGVLVEQRLGLNSWANHLQQAYYQQHDIPSWTLAHPYENPLAPLTLHLPPADNGLRHVPQPWFKGGFTKQDFPWVELDTSLQWQAFQRAIEMLQQRGNRVFVLVGPFNEHMLIPESLQRYQEIKAGIAAWLQQHGIPHAVPAALPSAEFGDASHPLAEGYKRLAAQMVEQSVFAHK
jgi:hypothetical protein